MGEEGGTLGQVKGVEERWTFDTNDARWRKWKKEEGRKRELSEGEGER